MTPLHPPPVRRSDTDNGAQLSVNVGVARDRSASLHLFFLALFFLALLLLAACGSPAPRAPAAPRAPTRADRGEPANREGEVLRGQASWYGPQFHGRPTASGERFNMNAISAAHKTLPFGTLVRVRNLDNGKQIEVRINDRGPFVEGRILDLSRGAARKLDMITAGVVPVEVRVLSLPWTPAAPPARRAASEDSSPTRTATENDAIWTVQVGAFLEQERAKLLAQELSALSARVEVADRWHRVRIGQDWQRQRAEDLAQSLRNRGYDATVVRQ